MSQFYKQAVDLYEYMRERAETNEFDELVFEGKLSSAFVSVGVSRAYYSPIRGLLLSPVEDPCIEIRQRGNSYQLSIVVLKHPPPEEWRPLTVEGLTNPDAAATLYADLDHRLKTLEDSLKGVNVLEGMRNLEERLSRIEKERDNGKEKV